MEIESYTLKDLAELEGRHPLTIKKSNRYIAVKIETKSWIRRAKIWLQKKAYSYRYIRVEDIKKALKNKIDFTYLTTK